MPRAKSTKNGNSSRKALSPAVAALAVDEVRVSSADVEHEIRIRAYELSARRGFEPGHEEEDWLVAEREVLSRQ